MDIERDFPEFEQKVYSERENIRNSFLKDPNLSIDDYNWALKHVPITFDTYQAGTDFTAQYPESIPEPVYLALGVGGESGELLECVKKLFRNKDGIPDDEFKEKLTKEAGDVLFYLSALMLHYGIKMSDVAKTNQSKLTDRQKRNVIKSSGDNR